jgi:CHASE domain
METYKPVLSPRLKLVQETDNDAYGVILAHPGVHTSQENVTRTNAVAQVVVRLPSFLHYALQSTSDAKDVYLYDTTGETPQFLGGMQVKPLHNEGGHYYEQGNRYHVNDSQHRTPETLHTDLPEVDFWEIPRPHSSRYFERELGIAGRKWTIVVVSEVYQADMLFVVLGGTIIFAASLLCAAWFHSHLRRIAKLNKIKNAQAVEKAEIAKVQAIRERELNEFMAHEVSC